jgi:hypothetical protein
MIIQLCGSIRDLSSTAAKSQPRVLAEYQKAPEVTRRRLYLEAMQAIDDSGFLTTVELTSKTYLTPMSGFFSELQRRKVYRVAAA